MKRFVILALCSCALLSCRSPAERDEQACLSYGHQYMSPDYAQCRERLAQQRHESAMQAQRLYAPAPPVATARQRTNTNCMPDGLGGFRCTTY